MAVAFAWLAKVGFWGVLAALLFWIAVLAFIEVLLRVLAEFVAFAVVLPFTADSTDP